MILGIEDFVACNFKKIWLVDEGKREMWNMGEFGGGLGFQIWGVSREKGGG